MSLTLLYNRKKKLWRYKVRSIEPSKHVSFVVYKNKDDLWFTGLISRRAWDTIQFHGWKAIFIFLNFVCLLVCLNVCLNVCLFVCLFVCLWSSWMTTKIISWSHNYTRSMHLNRFLFQQRKEDEGMQNGKFDILTTNRHPAHIPWYSK